MANRPAYPHLTVLAPVHAPASDTAGYITGADGRCLGFGSYGAHVALLPRRTAVDMIIRHHYSHRVVNNSYLHLGVYLKGDLAGVMQLGYALNPLRVSHVVRDTPRGGMLELNRMWLADWAPHGSESRALAQMVRFVRRALPAVAWIQSFADERCGAGGVYQAANFLYLGSHTARFWELDGVAYHQILASPSANGGLRGQYLQSYMHRAVPRTWRQFRYIFLVKSNIRRRLVMRPQPYPKLDRQVVP